MANLVPLRKEHLSEDDTDILSETLQSKDTSSDNLTDITENTDNGVQDNPISVERVEILEKQLDALEAVNTGLLEKDESFSNELKETQGELLLLNSEQKKQQQSLEAINMGQDAIQDKLQDVAKQHQEQIHHLESKTQGLEDKTEQLDENLTHLSELQEVQFNKVTENIADLEEKDVKVQEKLEDIDQLQTEQHDKIDQLESISAKLADISDKLSDKTTRLEDRQDKLLEEHTHLASRTGTLENNVLETKKHFQKTTDKLSEQWSQETQALSEKDTALQEQLSAVAGRTGTLESQYSDLDASTNALGQHQLVLDKRTATLRQKFQYAGITITVVLSSILIAGGFLYTQNNNELKNLQNSDVVIGNDIAQLTEQINVTNAKQLGTQEKLLQLEAQLGSLQQAYQENKVSIEKFEQQYARLSESLNQLGSELAIIDSKLDENIEQQNIYKRLQFSRADNQPIYDKTWIKAQNKRYYTVQLMSAKSPEAVFRFVSQYQLGGDLAYIKTRNAKGQEWYSVVVGAYPDKQSAQAMINGLPAEIKANKPWMRSFAHLQKKIL